MLRRWLLTIGLTGFGAAFAHGWRLRIAGRHEPGGILIENPLVYDRLTRMALGALFEGIAADIASGTTPGAAVLDVGCGPGHLAVRLAGEHGLAVTGLDLDPAMIERAEANAAREALGEDPRPRFVSGDVARLTFPDASFDVVVSTFSVHHWQDPVAGLAELGRVVRPGGRILIWDLRPGFGLFHLRVPDPTDDLARAGLRVVSVASWRWPWRLALIRRLELEGWLPA